MIWKEAKNVILLLLTINIVYSVFITVKLNLNFYFKFNRFVY